VAIKLNEVIPWGRSFGEYRRMFALSDADLAGRILGCGDGPASFNAEATGLGHAVVSCDPIYAFSPAEIERRVEDCYGDLIAQVRTDPDGFVWDHFHDPDHLGQCRLAAMRSFLADFEAGKAEGRYIMASLPYLPFEDGQFDLALVSHLLFLYSDQLDFNFHRAAVEELLRVAREVRIFPLLTLERRPSPHVGPICTHVAGRGWRAEVCGVPYEFRRSSNEMLRLSREVRPPRLVPSKQVAADAAATSGP
jgi:SAM-dependent methyltransferase